jgi:hypothetical protein
MSRNRPTQKKLEPNNPLEEEFLRNNSFYGKDESKMIDEIRMMSAMKDLREFGISELIHPSKEVREDHTLWCSLPNADELKEETVTRVRRVPMTYGEAADHFEKHVQYLRSLEEAEGGISEQRVAQAQSRVAGGFPSPTKKPKKGSRKAKENK